MSMENLLYERKLKDMQEFVPFIEKVIEKLKTNEQDKPRKTQLQKMEILLSLLTSSQHKK